MQLNQLPDSKHFPKPVADLIDELERLRVRKIAADRDLFDLIGDGSNASRDAIEYRLKLADEAALAAATRNGETITGRPATDQYQRDVDDARLTVDATDAAVETCTSDLLAALRQHEDKVRPSVSKARSEALAAYADAIDQLAAARHRVGLANSLTDWLESVYVRRPRYLNYATDATANMLGASMVGMSDSFGTLIAKLRAEVDAHLEADRTPDPDDEPALSAA